MRGYKAFLSDMTTRHGDNTDISASMYHNLSYVAEQLESLGDNNE